MRILLSAAGLLLCVQGASASAKEADRTQILVDMRAIYQSVEVLLPLSVDEAAFQDPAQREIIRKALEQLAARAAHVGGHVAGGDRRVRFLGSSLAEETRETLARFDAGRFDSARFFSARLTDFCIACHTRLPSPTDSAVSRGFVPLADDFVSDAALAKLPLERRGELQVATRRFDDALTTFEAVIREPSGHPAALLEPLTQYLTVSIRVKNDLVRPVPVLKQLAARPDLWRQLRQDVDQWVATLERYGPMAPGAGSLPRARALLKEARAIADYPTDRQVLVHYLIASSELHRYLERRAGESDRDVAEAYYWLGLIESRLRSAFWISEADFYLETAIRIAPGESIAQQAFGLLEEETVLGWTGSGGSSMPEDVRQNLEALRALAYPD